MPLMTQIRESMTKVFAVFAGVFVVYIVLDWGMDLTGRKQAKMASQSQMIGQVNDEPITYKDFSELVSQTAENQKAQTGTDPDENQLRTIREQVWNQLVESHLYDEQIRKFGITVSDQEIIDVVRGPNPPEFLRGQFTDSTGTFNRQNYESAIMDPRNKEQIRRVEDIVRKQRLREKLQSIVMASVRATEGDVLSRFIDQNVQFDADYILFNPGTLVKDAEITADEPALRKYYNEHPEEFKVEATRRLRYVQFLETPSKSDSDGVTKELEDISRRAKAGADFTELAKTFSETPIVDTYFKHGELTPEKEQAVFAAQPGDIIGPVKEFNGYHLIKVVAFQTGKDEFVRASHILIRVENNDSTAALQRAKDIYNRAKQGEDFASLASQFSTDGSAAKGGDLGWFGKGRMVKPFEEAAYKAKVGQVVGPVKTQFGYHIIKLTARDNREVKIHDIHMKVNVSAATRSDVSQRAQDFAYLAKEGDFVKEAEQSKYPTTEPPAFQKNAVISGLGMNSTANKFAFNNKLGAVSDVISIQNGFIVAMVSEVKEAGIQPFDDVKTLLETKVKQAQRIEKTKAIASQLRQSLAQGDGLQKITAQRTDLQVQHAGPATIVGMDPLVSRDISFVGALTALNPGEVSNPIEGQRGVYIIKLLSKSALDTATYNSQREMLLSQIVAEKKSRFFSEWSENLKKSAAIVDNRDLFYR
jgi:peptidylprolyl isomerase/peptidyl-prolyl cis-trans isomerase D